MADCLRSPAAAAACGLAALGPGDQHLRFLLLQLVVAVHHLHIQGVTLGGDISAATVLLQRGGWLQLLVPPTLSTRPPQAAPVQQQGSQGSQGSQQEPRTGSLVSTEVAVPRLPACLRHCPPTLPALTAAWQHHALSSLDYLMLLNLLAGRRLGDRTFHPFVPWTTDFTVHPQVLLGGAATSSGGGGGGVASGATGVGRGGSGGGSSGGGGGGGWHDLTQSRYRQAKGDLQLDVTFTSSEVPHHIPQVRQYGSTAVPTGRSLTTTGSSTDRISRQRQVQ